MSADTLREGRQNTEFYSDLLASVMREVSAGVYQLVTTTGISDRVMSTLREGRPDVPYFDDLWSKVMSYDAGTDKWYLNVSGGGGGGGNLQTTLDSGNTANNVGIILTENSVDNSITLEPTDPAIHLQKDSQRALTAEVALLSGATDIAGQVTLKRIDTGSGEAISNTIRALNPNEGSSVSVFNSLQATNGVLLQDNNLSGVGLTINQSDVIINDANLYVNGSAGAQTITIQNPSGLRNGNMFPDGFSIDKLDGGGSPDGYLMNLNENSLSWQDTSLSGSVSLQPNLFNNQTISLPDITGGMKTVGTFNDTFVSGVITLTDSRFDLGQPNFIVMITDTNSSSALGQAYKFELLTLPTRVKITSLKQNGTTETNDVSSVRISCLF